MALGLAFFLAAPSAFAAPLASNRALAVATQSPSSHKRLVAQTDSDSSGTNTGDDAYDPFVDYSQYEDASQEEADINFFENGRFFTLGFLLGMSRFTGTLGSIFASAPDYGLYFSYFFDLRFALQFTFLTGGHTLSFTTPSGTYEHGNGDLTSYGLGLKYYFNTQNVTRGLAQLNPYVIGGFSQVTRTTTVNGDPQFGKEGATGLDLGVGIELPMMHNKMYFGGQLTYELVNFPDESSEIIVNETERTGLYPTGDVLMLNAILGINF